MSHVCSTQRNCREGNCASFSKPSSTLSLFNCCYTCFRNFHLDRCFVLLIRSRDSVEAVRKYFFIFSGLSQSMIGAENVWRPVPHGDAQTGTKGTSLGILETFFARFFQIFHFSFRRLVGSLDFLCGLPTIKYFSRIISFSTALGAAFSWSILRSILLPLSLAVTLAVTWSLGGGVKRFSCKLRSAILILALRHWWPLQIIPMQVCKECSISKICTDFAGRC